MSIEKSELSKQYDLEDVFTDGNLLANNEDRPVHETPEYHIFRLALAIASEPSKLAQLRHMLASLEAASAISEEFSTWAIARIDERLMSMALEYAHDAEIILQLLSLKCGSLNRLMLDIEDLYRQEKITQRVYVRAKLLLRDIEASEQ